MSQKIEYLRTKVAHSDKIVYDNGEYKVKRTITSKGYDHILGKWNITKTESKLLPIAEIGCFKELNQVVYVKRSAYDALLKPVELFIKIVRKVEVINKFNNIFLTESCNRLFQSDVARGITCPIPQNGVPQGLKIEKLSETALTPQETSKLREQLTNPKILLKPLIFEETSIGELRALV